LLILYRARGLIVCGGSDAFTMRYGPPWCAIGGHGSAMTQENRSPPTCRGENPSLISWTLWCWMRKGLAAGADLASRKPKAAHQLVYATRKPGQRFAAPSGRHGRQPAQQHREEGALSAIRRLARAIGRRLRRFVVAGGESSGAVTQGALASTRLHCWARDRAWRCRGCAAR